MTARDYVAVFVLLLLLSAAVALGVVVGLLTYHAITPDVVSASRAAAPSPAAGTVSARELLPEAPSRSPGVSTPSPTATGTRPAPSAMPRTSQRPAGFVPSGASLRGTATWFRSPVGVSAAGPRLRAAIGPGWRGTVVRVCAAGRCTRTILGDWMRADRLVDLDDGAFLAVCGALSRGVCAVTVTWRKP